MYIYIPVPDIWNQLGRRAVSKANFEKKVTNYMAGLKFWLCLSLVLCSVSTSKARSPPAFSNKGNRALIHSVREALKASSARQVGRPFESKRRSPGGPDPRHH